MTIAATLERNLLEIDNLLTYTMNKSCDPTISQWIVGACLLSVSIVWDLYENALIVYTRASGGENILLAMI